MSNASKLAAEIITDAESASEDLTSASELIEFWSEIERHARKRLPDCAPERVVRDERHRGRTVKRLATEAGR